MQDFFLKKIKKGNPRVRLKNILIIIKMYKYSFCFALLHDFTPAHVRACAQAAVF